MSTVGATALRNYNSQTKIQEEVSKIKQLKSSEEHPLMHLTAVFPFDFFPNEVIVDKTKVTIIHKYFFWTRQVTTIMIEDILNVSIQHSLIFAALVVVDRYFAQEPIVINYLWKNDASRAAGIIQGLLLANKKNIDVQSIPSDQLADVVEEVGIPEQGRDDSAI